MQADQPRSDDDLPEPESDARLRPLGGHLGAAMASLQQTVTKRHARAETQTREPEEKPFELPLMDEEEIAEIADPHEREQKRRRKIAFYKQYPNAYEHYMERSEQLKAERNKVVMLQPWADDKRAAPNIIYRSALFPALNSQKRKFIKAQKVYSVGGLEVTFTGEQFDQTDLDVYLEILNLAKTVPLGQPVKFSAYSLLKALGRCTGKSDHIWLHSVLIRLRGGTVEMVTGKARFFGGLIEGGIRDEITHHYEVIINPNYAKFFGFGLWSAIDLDQRRQLAQKSIAKALHAYYSSHTDPAPHRYETLAAIVGLENKNPRDAKAKLIRAHEVLKQIGFLLDYEAGPDKIAIKATMTPSQQRHVIKKITKTPKTT